jgi:hypothetical protein
MGTIPLAPECRGLELSHIRDFNSIADTLNQLPNDLDIVLTGCAMGDPRGPFNLGGHLALRDINANEDIIPLLRCWQGSVLDVDNCPGFNDAVLDKMTTIDAGEYSCASCLDELNILNCPNFSAGALMRFVSARLEVVDGSTSPRLTKLSVSGFAPNISTEDQQQISQHVDKFKYSPSSS